MTYPLSVTLTIPSADDHSCHWWKIQAATALVDLMSTIGRRPNCAVTYRVLHESPATVTAAVFDTRKLALVPR